MAWRLPPQQEREGEIGMESESRCCAQVECGPAASGSAKQACRSVRELSAGDSTKWGSVVTLRWLYRIARNIADKLNTIAFKLKSSLTKLDSVAGTAAHRKLRLKN